MATTKPIAAVDPGPKPGLAFKLDGKYHTMWCQSPAELYETLKTMQPDWVALELFSRSNRIDANMIKTMECVGGVQSLCVYMGVVCHEQRPGQQRSFLVDGKPFLLPGAAPHEKDALAHLLLREHLIRNDGNFKGKL